MKFSELASRYSKALFELAKESGDQEKVFGEVRAFSDLLEKNEEIKSFLTNPLIKSEDKEAALQKALNNSGIGDLAKNFLLVLAQKDRLELFEEIVEALQFQTDEAHGVTRGLVRSATVLGPSEREGVEKTVSKVTGKQVILTYKEDPTLIGGVVAQVGSFTFDDSLASHLTRLKEEINRRTH